MFQRLAQKIPLPYPHFMAFAPLDAWWRLLWRPRARVPAAYWPRLGLGLFTSALATLLTLPERVVVGAALRIAARRRADGAHAASDLPSHRLSPSRAVPRLSHGPGTVVILGYFRSGTTHLHYLMSCDPRMRTPTWAETLAPQGFFLSWAFLRLFMIPFVSAKRPQDDVAIGPSWPAEDDFAVNNWTLASSLPGRFILPRLHAYYERFHSLAGLSGAERGRWAWTQWAFCRKVTWLSPRRVLLLKTPSHTARVAALRALFGERVKFVHISREPGAVVRSNVTMASRLSLYNLEPPAEEREVRARVVAEYVSSERRYLDESRELPADRLVETRYEDLVADPMGTLRGIYSGLGIPWSAEFERRARAYLASVRDYRAASGRAGERNNAAASLEPELLELAARFGHDRSAVADAPAVEGPAERGRGVRGAVYAGVAALACAVLWLDQSWIFHDRHDWLAWPVGVAIGWAAIRAARVGSVWLGVLAALLTAVVFVGTALPSTFLMDYAQRPNYRFLPMERWEWYHIEKATRHGLLAWNNLFWAFMGCVTAYRFASREHVNPPGRG